MPDWSFEQESGGRCVIKHHATPRFSAQWASGKTDLAGINGQCWRDPGSGDGMDSLHIFGFQWSDPVPDVSSFEQLMQEAAQVIDAWIASQF